MARSLLWAMFFIRCIAILIRSTCVSARQNMEFLSPEGDRGSFPIPTFDLLIKAYASMDVVLAKFAKSSAKWE